MRFKLGLTGSIGMGKSTTARMFVEQGCALWDADQAVHRLYARGGSGVDVMSTAFPDAVHDGVVDRARLRQIIAADETALPRIESIVHPLVMEDRTNFIQENSQAIGIFDIPLLFETGGDNQMDATACVSIPKNIQRERVLARGTMTAEDLDRILSRQMPNTEKCARATWVIETDTLEHARQQVADILSEIEEKLSDA